MAHLLLTLLLQLLCLIIVSKAEDLNITDSVDSVAQVQYLNLPDGYVAYPDIGVAYRIPNESVSWNEARKRCLLDGAQLAAIDSAKKLEYVKNQRPVKDLTFVGIHSYFGNDEWVNVGNGSVVSSIPWNVGEPNNDDFHCVVLYRASEGLANYPCDYHGNYVCERPIFNGHQHQRHKDTVEVRVSER